MIKNYILIAWRNLLRQKLPGLINTLGLSIGLACFSLFLLFAVNEFSYDRFHANANNIYRVYEWVEGIKGRNPGGEAPGYTPLGPALKSEFPDVEKFARIQTQWQSKFVKVNNEVIRSLLGFADAQLFEIFSFKILAGNASKALQNPHHVVITKQKAIQLFGTVNAVGKRIDIKVEEEFVPFTVGAVTEDIPANSSIRYAILGSYEYLLSNTRDKISVDKWNMTIGSETYLQLRPGSTLPRNTEAFAGFRKKYYADEEAALKKEGLWNGKDPYPIRFLLQPMREVHTNPRIGGMAETIDPKFIWILISIAAGILLIACINFTTLSIGRSAGRAKEIGVRKVMGSRRKQLVKQFLTESLLLSVFSGAVALVLVQLIIPFFNEMADRSLVFSFSQFPEFLWLLIATVIITGLVAGIYPAFVLSAFQPVEVLKSRLRLSGSNVFTKSLVTLQFILSISLIISTIVILQQLKFLRSKDLGFNKENVIMVDAEGSDTKRIYPLLKQQLQSEPGIAGVTASEMGLGAQQGQMGSGFEFKGETKGLIMYPVDENFIPVMGLKLIAGRNFNPSLSNDSNHSIIVNETMLRDFQLTLDKAVGSQIFERNFGGGPTKAKTIIGVIKNFNYSSLTNEVRPQIFTLPGSLEARKVYVRTKAGDLSTSLASLERTWKKVAGDLPFQYSFLDENFNKFYRNEERWGKIAGAAGFISVFLASLGLFGLTSLVAANRTKEIGIRKVLGASATTIINLLSRDFLKLVAIAIVIAVPVTWWFISRWLENYAYRIDVSWVVFVLTGIVALLIALGTISLQAMKTAMGNPAKSLRTE